MSEKAIEAYGKRVAERQGAWVIKLGMLGGRGWPDHTIVMKGKIIFIEYKIPGGAFQPGQKAIHRKLLQYGFPVHIITSKAEVDGVLNGGTETS